MQNYVFYMTLRMRAIKILLFQSNESIPFFLKPILKLRGMLTPQEGARTTLYCSLDAPHNETGQYYSSEEISSPTYVAESDALAMELWDRSYQWTRKFM